MVSSPAQTGTGYDIVPTSSAKNSILPASASRIRNDTLLMFLSFFLQCEEDYFLGVTQSTEGMLHLAWIVGQLVEGVRLLS